MTSPTAPPRWRPPASRSRTAGAHLRVAAPATAGADVTRALASTGQWVSELRIEEVSLEDLFLEITSGSSAPATEEVLA